MIDLKHYGYKETEAVPTHLLPGRVTELRRERFTVITEYGEVNAVLKGSFYHSAAMRADFPCVGDFVLLHHNDSGDSLIDSVLPRHSKFSRADHSGHAVGYTKTILEQVVATNFDFVFIVTSLNADFSVNRLLRYLTQARQSGGQPVVILTKADLVEDYEQMVAEVEQSMPEVPVHAISSQTGFGMDALAAYMQPAKTIILLGMSGVGKSSLVNALIEQDVMKVSEIREDDSRGRHTTTHRQLFMLPTGSMIIDTPGMRELGLFDADEGLSTSFQDVEQWFSQCRFSDCGHRSEPGCAVTAALADGSLSQERWDLYNAQMQELKFVNNKTGYLIEKRANNKALSMQHKEKKKRGIWKK